MTREEAILELSKILDDGSVKSGVPAEEVLSKLNDMLAPRNIIYLTGDTHGNFDRIVDFCSTRDVEPENTLVILGDVGLNYYGSKGDAITKRVASKLPITFFCIHGNHEMRPSEDLGYELSEYRGGQVWVQREYPNILFAIDGEIYDFRGHSCLVIGGAYSVDKYYRLALGANWFADEQPSEEIKRKVESALAARNWRVDVVFSHTCPVHYEPLEVFMSGVDQSKVDKSTEIWLGEIEKKLSYDRWYCGHYHTEKKIDKMQFMFEDYALLPYITSLEEEHEITRRLERQAEIVLALGLLNGGNDE